VVRFTPQLLCFRGKNSSRPAPGLVTILTKFVLENLESQGGLAYYSPGRKNWA
jgi:hypothetical protein